MFNMAVIHPLVAREASPDHHVDRSMQTWNKATQSLCIIFMTAFFGLRVYTRTSLLRNWGQEDCEFQAAILHRISNWHV